MCLNKIFSLGGRECFRPMAIYRYTWGEIINALVHEISLFFNPSNSDSTILKFLKFLTKLLGQAIPYRAAAIEVWLNKIFVYFNCSVH